jgi:dTDP-4-amino-4,6-dideoxygalactose transaminase
MCALDLKRGDKVICSVNSFVDVPEVVRHFDAEPIFVDIDKNYLIDLDKLEQSIKENKSKKLRAVIVNHIGGQSVELDKLYAMAKRYKLKVIEDATFAMGGKYKDKFIGNSGADMVVFDLNHNDKFAKGGMITTNDPQLYERAILIREHGLEKSENSLNYIYDLVDLGWDYKLSQLEANYNLLKFKNIKDNLKRLEEIADIYDKNLTNLKGIKLPQKTSQQRLQYIIEINTNRDNFALELQKRGVEVWLHFIPLHITSYYKNKYELKIYSYPNALDIYAKVMSLPFYPSLSDKEVLYICEMIKEVVKNRGA